MVQILAGKENIPLKAIMEGLNATENQCVSKEIQNLLSPDELVDNGSGDKPEDLSIFASHLVDEVIAKAEETTGNGVSDDEVEDDDAGGKQIVNESSIVENGNGDSPTTTNNVDDIPATNGVETEVEESGKPTETADVEEDQIAKDKLVETSVQVHKTEEIVSEKQEDETDVGVVKEEVVSEETTANDINAEEEEVPYSSAGDENLDRNVNFAEMTTFIEDGKQNHSMRDEERSSPSITNSSPSPTFISYKDSEVQQNDSENEDVDNIDIEKEFVMPPESAVERNVDNNNVNSSKTTNGNDSVLDNGNKSDNETIEDKELAAILAKKELVRKQVEMFEKNSPAGGKKVNYTIRTANHDKEAVVTKPEGAGSNVKNLKNFFQQLSTSENTSSPPSSGNLKLEYMYDYMIA